jgi:hypothetical protein
MLRSVESDYRWTWTRRPRPRRRRICGHDQAPAAFPPARLHVMQWTRHVGGRWWVLGRRMSMAPIDCKSMSKRVVSNASIPRASSALLTHPLKWILHLHPDEQGFFFQLTLARPTRLQHPFPYRHV